MSFWSIFLGFVVGYVVSFYRTQASAKEIIQKVIDESPKTYFFKIEFVGDVYYAYDLDTGLFLGQNADINKLGEEVKGKKPGYHFYIAVSNKETNSEPV